MEMIRIVGELLTMGLPQDASEKIRPDVWVKLLEKANERGETVDDLLNRVLDELGSAPDKLTLKAQTGGVEGFVAALESLADADVTPLPRDFSREDIYFPQE